MKELAHLNKYLLKYKYYLLLGFIFLIITSVFAIYPAVIVRNSINLIIDNSFLYKNFRGLENQELFRNVFFSNVIVYGGLILLAALLRGFFLFLVRQTIIVMSRKIEYDLKNEIFSHYQTLPLSFYRRNNTGDLMARISEDVNHVRMYLGPGIMYGLNMFTLFAILIPFMFSISTKLTLYVLIPLPVLSISIYFVNNLINKRSMAIQKALSKLSTFVQEAFSGIRVTKSFTREEDSIFRFQAESREYRNKAMKLEFVNAFFFPLIMSLIGLSVILTIFVGGVEVINGAISPGVIAEFIIYVNLLTWPVTSLGWISSIIQRAAASQKRINEFLNVKTEIISQKNIKPAIEGHILFDNVSFTYPDTGIQALKNVSFEVHPGQTIALIGTTGSGKTTIANLMARLYDAKEGNVSIDKAAIEDLDIEWLRSHIGFVPQDVFLFSDTIRNNIIFGSAFIDEQKVMQAVEDADLTHNINRFNDGLNTRVGERGITLSGGQKQRVSIARAIIREPRILILDDCLSAVDTKTENAILNNLKRIMADRTSIIISHRVSSAKLADKILVLDDGEIKERGTHMELMKQKGIYAELYDKQMKSEEEGVEP